MKTIVIAGILVGLAGCGRGDDPENPTRPTEPGTFGMGFDRPTGPGRFTDVAIKRSVAPSDGPALMLILSEHPIAEAAPQGPRVVIGIYRDTQRLSGKRIRLDHTDMKPGVAHWIDRDWQMTRLDWAEIEFEDVRDGKPVTGWYAFPLPDGSVARGSFVAKWWSADWPGG
jgi:hypothetical protein